jgi:hypothetical protein
MMIDLMQALVLSPGDCQKFIFKQRLMSSHTSDSLFTALATGRPFRTLEVLELDEIELRQVEPSKVLEGLRMVIQRCTCRGGVSLSKWMCPVPFNFAPFDYSHVLNEMVILRQDLSVLPTPFVLPVTTSLIDFSGCMCTFQSFERLLEISANCATRASLVMRDWTMPDDHFCALFAP